MFLGNLFILKTDKSTFLSTAITPQCSVAESCAYAVHSSYYTVKLRAVTCDLTIIMIFSISLPLSRDHEIL